MTFLSLLFELASGVLRRDAKDLVSWFGCIKGDRGFVVGRRPMNRLRLSLSSLAKGEN